MKWIIGILRRQEEREMKAKHSICEGIPSVTLQDVSLYPQTALAPLVDCRGDKTRNHSVLIGQHSEIKQQRIIHND